MKKTTTSMSTSIVSTSTRTVMSTPPRILLTKKMKIITIRIAIMMIKNSENRPL